MYSDKSSVKSVKFGPNLTSTGTQTDSTGPINSYDASSKPNTLGVRVAPRRLQSERKVQYERPKSADAASDSSAREGKKKIDAKSNSSKIRKSKTQIKTTKVPGPSRKMSRSSLKAIAEDSSDQNSVNSSLSKDKKKRPKIIFD